MFSTASNHLLSMPKSPGFHHRFENTNSRRKKSVTIRCCTGKKSVNYYNLLGVSVDSNRQEIKEAYRKLQKKHHPDVAGQRGHEYTIMLNEAYRVLMTEDRRRNYNASIDRAAKGREYTGIAYSSWKGPLRPHALFVDENACIGCGECVYHANNTFMMDESLGCARVNVQFGDEDRKIEVSLDSCPVNCIHWVDREDLPVLEHLIRPQPKESYGVFQGGWERPSNVFAAAKYFSKQLKQQDHHHNQGRGTNAERPVDEETTAQAKARAMASIKLQTEQLSRLWSWLRDSLGLNR